MAIITKAELSSVSQTLLESALESYAAFSSFNQETTVFLSHKHSDVKEVKELKMLLENLGVRLYVDWLDPDMPETTRGETATKIKKKIKENDKFILLATDGAIESKWCNWELGFGDSQKLSSDKILLFPLSNFYDRSWTGSEYMQIYPVVEYEDGKNRNNAGEMIEKGYYVFYPSKNNSRTYCPLNDWLRRH